jgi:Protein of unknown function DUF72
MNSRVWRATRSGSSWILAVPLSMAARATAAATAAWSQQGREVFCYFDNDEAGYAAHNALQVQNLLRRG